LTATAPSPDGKIRILSSYVQKQVRYVAIEIGIGGYQPHAAASTFANKYGDCKDKATLLIVMLREAGIRAYPIAIYSARGAVSPDFPSPYQFNHMIVAIELQADSQFAKSSAAMEVESLGRVLFFDPTSEMWPIGTLVDELQNNMGLLMAGAASRLITLPTAPAADSQFKRTGEITLAADGTVHGKITEEYTGSWAARMREELAVLDNKQKGKLMDLLLNETPGLAIITHAEIQDQHALSNPLILRYEFQASDYGKLTGDLMLVRPRASGSVAEKTIEWKSADGEARKLPLEYDHTGVISEVSTVELPAGFQVDELPDPLAIHQREIGYKSTVEVKGRLLTCRRDLSVGTLTVSPADVSALKSFYREVSADEQKSVVLKRDK
jgi:hypothetical protein